MDEAPGATQFVDSKNALNAQIQSGVTLGSSSSYIVGDTTTASTFDGTNGYASVGDVAALNVFTRTAPFTITAIVKPNVTRSGGALTYWVYTKARDSSPYNGLEFGIRWNGSRTGVFLQFGSNYPTQFIRLLSSNDLANGQTYLIGVTYDGSGAASGVKMYVDGSEVSSALDSGTSSQSIAPGEVTTASGYAAELGRWGAVGQRYKGDAKDVAIFSIAQTSTWMQTLHTLALGGKPVVSTPTTSLLNSTSVTLNSSITYIGGENATIVGFNYGLTDSYGSVASSSGTFGAGAFSKAISGLTANTTYHYQSYATNSYGTTTSGDQTFTTTSFDNVVYTVNQSPRPQVFYDFDMDSDIDDVVDALTLLNLEHRGELDIVGAVSTSCHAKSAPTWIAIANYYGRGSIPTGVNTSSPGNGGCPSSYVTGVAATYGVAGKTDASQFDNYVNIQRSVLASAANNSIEYITTGDLSSVQGLLQSSADQYSSLTGVQLVTQKIRHIWIVAGRWPSGAAVSDMGSNPVISNYVLTNWPSSVPMIFDSITDGDTVYSGENVMEALPANNPARAAWELYFGNSNASNKREGWSQLAMLSIARGVYPNSTTATDYEEILGGSGTGIVNSTTGVTSWNSTQQSNHGYLSKILSDANFTAAINALLLDAAPTSPGTPSTTTPTSNNQPAWTWTVSTDGGDGLAATPYTVQWCGNSSFTGCDSNTSISATNSFTHPSSLADGTWYFRVKATDTLGNISSYSSTSSVVVDTTEPTITSVSAGTLDSTGATITWTTNENTSSKVDYGLTNSYGSTTSETDTSTRVASHSVALSNLVACSTYHYRVRSKDSALNEIIDSDNTFTTTGCTGSASVDSQTASNITTASGGSINLLSDSKGITLTVPASFSGSDANFQIKQLDKTSVTNTTSTPTGYSLIGTYLYDLKALTDISTSISSFDNAITVSIAYGTSDISGINESSLKVYRWDGSSWNQLSGCSVNTSTKTVSCTTTAFSVFGLFGQASTSSSSSSLSSSSSSTSAPSCGDQAPGAKAPWLYGAIAQDSGSVLLYFTEADNPVNKYVLEYGTKSGDYPYGVQDMGINLRGQMTFLVKSLSSNTTYYFRVRGGNGCATGTWSNEISAKTKGIVTFNQLEITQSQLEPQLVTEIPNNASCQTYTVKSGDTLWSIAKNLLGDGNKYKDIIEQNKDKYSSLETSNNLQTGWELKVNCEKQILDGGKKKLEPEVQDGYDVKVKVVDTNKKPVEGAKVTIHSKVQEALTNKDGVAEFKNVEQGEHRVIIAYNNFEGEQSVNLTGDVKEFDLNVTVQQKAISLSPLAYAIIGIMGLIIIGLIVLLIKSKRKE